MPIKKAVKLIFVVLVLAMIGSLVACSGGPSEEEKQQEYVSRFDSLQEERKEEFHSWYNERQPSIEESRAGLKEEFKAVYDSLSEERRDEATALFNELYEAHQTLEPTPEEREEELRKLVDSLSGEHQRAEILEIIDSLIFDGKHEIPSLVLKLSGVDAEKVVVDPYRQVLTEIGFDVTAEEALEIYNEILASEGQEPVEELPPAISISEEGRVYVPGAVFEIFPPIMVGQLGVDNVMIPDLTYVATCRESEDDPSVIVQFTIIPTAEEGAWKEEVLFDGTAQELCGNGESSPTHYPDKGWVVFERPNIKVFPVPNDGPIRVASVDNLRAGGLLAFPKSTPSGSLELGFGLLDGVRRVGGNLAILQFSPTSDTLEGTPLFYVTGEKSEPVMLVGYVDLDSSGVFARSAEFYLAGVEEFPHVMVNPGE